MYNQLTEPERYTLGVLNRQGMSHRAIAREVYRTLEAHAAAQSAKIQHTA